MIFNRFFLFIFLTPIFWLTSCKHEPINPKGVNHNSQDTTKTLSGNCHADTVYYSNTIAPLLASKCGSSGCHGNGSANDGVSVANYASLINSDIIDVNDPENSDLYEVITGESKLMPPSPNAPLSQEEIEKVFKWMKQGAKNNGCKEGCDTVNVTFSGSIFPIVETNCIGCHASISPTSSIPIGNYSEVKYQVTKNKFYQSVNHENGFSPMPKGTDKLSDCDLKMIKKWIADGAPDN